jgi:hypothetical protein
MEMTEVKYHVKVDINWGIFVLASLLIVAGIGLMFTPVTEQIYIYSDYRYDYYTDVMTYPYMSLGLILDVIGLLMLIASFFIGDKISLREIL